MAPEWPLPQRGLPPELPSGMVLLLQWLPAVRLTCISCKSNHLPRWLSNPPSLHDAEEGTGTLAPNLAPGDFPGLSSHRAILCSPSATPTSSVWACHEHRP